MHNLGEDDVRTVMAHEGTMIGSDGIPSLEGKPHPRLYGSFARVLGRYARDGGVFPIEEAVRRMTSLPADSFGLVDRGRLRPGAHADLVVFDPGTVDDVATFDDPHQPPRGIHHVVVNGERVVTDAVHTGARPGRTLRRP
ncbi:MAG: amidohydrolase family protein [Acidimicrobiia bacterium]|nr:amidohydrolase family protein [Acidimicrobiia bacterium]